MRGRPRPALLSVLLVAAVSVAVFASSSLALQGVTTSAEPLLTDEVRQFAELYTKGEVKVNAANPDIYRLEFQAVFTVGDNVVEGKLTDRPTLPDVTIEQSIHLPTLDEGTEFVGPLALPFSTQELVLRVVIHGDCFAGDNKGRIKLRFAPGCHDAMLVFDGQAFDAGELVKSMEAKLVPNNRRPGWWIFKSEAVFMSPGYGFPIASLGEGMTTFLIGDMGGATMVRKVEFAG